MNHREKSNQAVEILAPGLGAVFAHIFEEVRQIAREEAQRAHSNNMGREEYLTPEEVCEWLKIKRTHLDILVGNSEIKPTKIGQLNRFSRTHLEEWLKSKVKGSDGPAKTRLHVAK